jgi:hypothetical protein
MGDLAPKALPRVARQYTVEGRATIEYRFRPGVQPLRVPPCVHYVVIASPIPPKLQNAVVVALVSPP